MASHRAGAVLAVAALMALAAPALATETCSAMGKECVDTHHVSECLAKNAKVWETMSGKTAITLMNADCFMLGDSNAVDLVSTVQHGSHQCTMKKPVFQTGKIGSFMIDGDACELSLSLYAVDLKWGSGEKALAPIESSCLQSDSERCHLCSYDLTIPIVSKACPYVCKDTDCPNAGCRAGMCMEDNTCGYAEPDDSMCDAEGCLPGVCNADGSCGHGMPDHEDCPDLDCEVGMCSTEGECMLVPGPDCDKCGDDMDCSDEHVPNCQKPVCKTGLDEIKTCVLMDQDAGASCDDGNIYTCDDKCYNGGQCAGGACSEPPCGLDWGKCCTDGGTVDGYCGNYTLECFHDEDVGSERCRPCGYDDGPACTAHPEYPSGCKDAALTNVDGICKRIAACGLDWQSCCETDEMYPSMCQNDGFGCVNGTCTVCGIEWRPACPGIMGGEAYCMDETLAPANDGNCQKCGGLGKPPCAMGGCTARYTVLADNICEPCGESMRLCCAHDADWPECRGDGEMCMEGTCMRAGSD